MKKQCIGKKARKYGHVVLLYRNNLTESARHNFVVFAFSLYFIGDPAPSPPSPSVSLWPDGRRHSLLARRDLPCGAEGCKVLSLPSPWHVPVGHYRTRQKASTINPGMSQTGRPLLSPTRPSPGSSHAAPKRATDTERLSSAGWPRSKLSNDEGPIKLLLLSTELCLRKCPRDLADQSITTVQGQGVIGNLLCIRNWSNQHTFLPLL